MGEPHAVQPARESVDETRNAEYFIPSVFHTSVGELKSLFLG